MSAAWHPNSATDVKPWSGRFTFPEFANKGVRVANRVPSRNGPTFRQGNTIRLEFPAQGYVNPAETTLVFDLKIMIDGFDTASTDFSVFMQQNINCIFSRARLMYGSTPIEDIGNVGFLIRQLTDWTGTSHCVLDQNSVATGIAGVRVVCKNTLGDIPTRHARKHLHSITKYTSPDANSNLPFTGLKVFPAGNSNTTKTIYATRRYQITFPFGLFQQGKLIPTKFMASQLAIELSLAPYAYSMMAHRMTALSPAALQSTLVPLIGTPVYEISNVNMLIETLEFDATYDAMFLDGLQRGGIPFLYGNWNSYTYPVSTNFAIQEKSRSVKSVFAILRLAVPRYEDDMGVGVCNYSSFWIQSYQYRIGGRYYPASPVIVSGNNDTYVNNKNSQAEPFIELQKCLNILGDNQLSTSCSFQTWSNNFSANRTWTNGNVATGFPIETYLPASCPTSDGLFTFNAENVTDGNVPRRHVPNGGCAGYIGSAMCLSTNLETTNGVEISGLNAEEQSDISLMVKYATSISPLVGQFNMEIFTYSDAVLILRENNVVELIK